ncbi:multiple myeloma tumor-associated protein, putative [Ixodes scapularis]|uniref:Multiple myeloma tumor-associated protein, putative n=1 Tax=Ixodes scapularis TaxID=6945 RepID=B7PZJ7_IXOSC|nr:multiple myeloma tumor-associated protein, putative [Ixodes scapularis]|eukprot:XP_002405315.1 multiple myeloma tumor-associated protein, putative [Ixodes scapularis]
MYHPVRGGSRGGADQFNWDDVKDDKYRENYLGHSLRAPVGRWQKGKDLTWYAKDPKAQGAEARAAARESELAAAKKAEEEAMLSALGDFSSRGKRSHEGVQFVSPAPPRPQEDGDSSKKRKAGQG